MQKLFDWQFGDLKVKFLKTAKSYEYTDNEISSIVNLIDNGISQLTS